MPPIQHHHRKLGVLKVAPLQLTLHVQDEVRVVRKTGNIFLTNIHRVYAGNESIRSPYNEDTMDYFFGPRPTGVPQSTPS